MVVNRPAPRLPGPMGQLRSQLGDRELLVDSNIDPTGRYSGRVYRPERPDKDERFYDDLSWYEGRYPEAAGGRGGSAAAGERVRLGRSLLPDSCGLTPCCSLAPRSA